MKQPRSIGPLVAVALGCALVAGPSACGSSGLVGGSCAEGYEFCDDECVDVSSDEDHCGGCDIRCEAGESCEDGTCRGGGGGSGGDGSASGGSAGDGGAPSGGNGGGPSSGGSGGVDGCFPPYDRASACGDCDTQCNGSMPLCAPDGASYSCTTSCTTAPFTTTCDFRCVDVDTDANHCGACFRMCASGICVAGDCVGATPGHMIAMCMNYEFFNSNAAQTVLLGNAIFLSSQERVRILGYTKHTTTALRNSTNAALAAAAQARGRSYRISYETDAADVVDRLDRSDFDVLLVYDQVNAPAGVLATTGATWATAAADFAGEGGVVLALTGGAVGSEMDELISALGISNVTDMIDNTGDRFHVRAAGDALAINVVSPFLGIQKSCVFDTTDVPAGDRVFVIGDTDPGVGTGLPGVVHRIVSH